jgi:small subunit ribosomal protein S4
MKRKHKTYSRPKRPFDKTRIDEEDKIKKEFGLKNKKEIWKADAKIKSIREKAKKLIKSSSEEQQALFNQLQKIGLNVNSIADVLTLEKEDYLKRRLQTIITKKELVNTIKSARQMITHRKVLVNEKIVDKPSYIVRVEEEKKIKVIKNKKKSIKIPHEKTLEEKKIDVKKLPNQEKAEGMESNKKTKQEINSK